MSDDRRRNLVEVRNLLQSCNGFNSEQTRKFYDNNAEMYEQDFVGTLEYQAPHALVDFLLAHFSGDHSNAQVLDVACGSGLVAKLMVGQGFKNFVGVDCSEQMLEEAAKTELYQDLQRALLGTEPLPVQTNKFDLVILVGGLGVGFVPVSVVRELCDAAKPGGLICLMRGNHSSSDEKEFGTNLERELQLMEDEGLWSRVAVKHVERYMLDPQGKTNKQEEDRVYITGSLYIYRKSSSSDGNSQNKKM
ncbi:methyltransferase-like protein 27 [Anableps anableps]